MPDPREEAMKAARKHNRHDVSPDWECDCKACERLAALLLRQQNATVRRCAEAVKEYRGMWVNTLEHLQREFPLAFSVNAENETGVQG